MGRTVLIVLAVVAVAYAVGWMSDGLLNDDPCVTTIGTETDRHEIVGRWFPSRTDCRVTRPDGTLRGIERGSPEVFLAMFALTLVAALMLVSNLALTLRAIVVLTAAAAAFLVIFIV